MGFSGKSWGRPNLEKSGVDPPKFHSMTDWEIGSVAENAFFFKLLGGQMPFWVCHWNWATTWGHQRYTLRQKSFSKFFKIEFYKIEFYGVFSLHIHSTFRCYCVNVIAYIWGWISYPILLLSTKYAHLSVVCHIWCVVTQLWLIPQLSVKHHRDFLPVPSTLFPMDPGTRLSEASSFHTSIVDVIPWLPYPWPSHYP